MSTMTRRALLTGSASALVATALPLPTSAASASPLDSRYLFTPSNPLALGTVLTRSVAGMPLANNSAQLAAAMAKLPSNYAGKSGFPWLRTSLNIEAYNIPIYVVDSRVPGSPRRGIRVAQLECAGDPVVDNPAIPCPVHAKPALGGDQSLAIYDRGTGILREYFHVDTSGSTWVASSAGYSYAGPDFALFKNNQPAQLVKGSSSVVKMHNPLSQIGLNEISAGVISHAVSFTMAEAAVGSSWPAKQGDGTLPAGSTPVEGQWFRLPPSLDVDSLNLSPLTRMIAKAVQRYGGYGADRNRWCHAFNLESPFTVPGGTQANMVAPLIKDLGTGIDGSIVNDFPWELTEWAPIDWKSTAQAQPAKAPLAFTASPWRASVTGSWAIRPTTALRKHAMIMDGTASSRSGTLTWSLASLPLAAKTTFTMGMQIVQRDAPVSIRLLSKGRVIAQTTSRGSKSMPFSLPAGKNDLQVQFVANAPKRGLNDFVALSSPIPV